MHAATMVTAGVYLVGRMFPLYQTPGFADDVKTIIILVGGATLLLAGLIALVQDDIKKLLAYSTLSEDVPFLVEVEWRPPVVLIVALGGGS